MCIIYNSKQKKRIRKRRLLNCVHLYLQLFSTFVYLYKLCLCLIQSVNFDTIMSQKRFRMNGERERELNEKNKARRVLAVYSSRHKGTKDTAWGILSVGFTSVGLFCPIALTLILARATATSKRFHNI